MKNPAMLQFSRRVQRSIGKANQRRLDSLERSEDFTRRIGEWWRGLRGRRERARR